MSTQVGEPSDPSAESARWRLNRAGIVNVYQYENEVLNFAGGRLLLRGVNGSGKSTAMNMLLPFLLTTHEGRIDAAGEQSGILKSWMLHGRDDRQPVGYLWIEFERQGEFLVCGCGIKANRAADSVRTWWFITSKRPGIDLSLVSGRVALSPEALRASLDGDEVFTKERRRDYRRTVEQRLFGGASIDQHIGLLNKVRSPRVGDRIDLDLREHLVDALPRLSEQALAQAAQPLDDLEEHRRSVAELSKTLEAVGGLLDVYRSYCRSDLGRRAEEGHSKLSALRKGARREKNKQRAAEEAEAEVTRLDAQRDEFTKSERRLRREIDALEKSPAYREGQQLDSLRQLVNDLSEQCEKAAQRVRSGEQHSVQEARALEREQQRSRSDVEKLNDALAGAAELARRCGLDRRPPVPVALSESPLPDIDSAEPEAFDSLPVDRELAAVQAAVPRRQADIGEVDEALVAEQSAQQQLRLAESSLESAIGSVERTSARLTENNHVLDEARNEWVGQILHWASQTHPLLQAAGIEAPETTAQALHEGASPRRLATAAGAHRATAAFAVAVDVDVDVDVDVAGVGAVDLDVDGDKVRAALQAEAEDLVEHWRGALGSVELRLSGEREAEQRAQESVDELARQIEPDPPRLDWQQGDAHCLADVIDFAAHLDEAQRAGLEAALEASGLLSARPVGGALELAAGQLVAVVASGVPNPLSEHLTVSVAERLATDVDEGTIIKLLGSISCDLSSDATTAVTLEGTFRVGSLSGRHSKARAEHVGATARRAALEKARGEAAKALDLARNAVERSLEERSGCEESLQAAKQQHACLPATVAIIAATADVEAAAKAVDEAVVERDAAKEVAAEAEQNLSHSSNLLHRTATTLSLPRDHRGLDAFRRDLTETASMLEQCRSRNSALGRSVDSWRSAAERRRTAAEACRAEQAELARLQSRHAEEHASLATIEDSIGAKYTEVVADIGRCRVELEDVESRLSQTLQDRDLAVNHRARADAERQSAQESRERAERECEATRVSLDDALSTPGYFAAISEEPWISARSAGSDGLSGMLDGLKPLLSGEPAETQADSVRQSLQRRRDVLGAGWDAEGRQPDPAKPLMVEVTGPSGRAPLAEQVQAVSQQHQQVAGLLSRKQDDALRELLQGLIAREIAEKIFNARRLVEQTNSRLGEISTAHRVGVRLRWRRAGELDPVTERMVELLAKNPDLRTDDDSDELRRALSNRLDEARADHPDLPYRQIIADALDYKQWHEMAVMVRRDSGEVKLGRNTPLSEGEKKLVTYLPLFAAVAASYDALSEQQAHSADRRLGIARFVLLDDAFAKVSEDNHAALFGLLVEFDLDLIATSERLWGTHGTVPELAVTEVIRDASLGAILLEHYRWNGATLELQGKT